MRHGAGGVALLVLALVFTAFATGNVGNYEVISNSMAPTLLTGDRVLVDQRREYTPHTGDVIVFEDPHNPGEMLTKRIAAVGGQVIRISHGYLFVDDKEWKPLGEPARVLGPEGDYERAPLGRDEIYVLGDNVGNSEDSLIFGPVPVGWIKGRLRYVYWPPGRIGKVQ